MTDAQKKEIYDSINRYVDTFGFGYTVKEHEVNPVTLSKIRKNEPVRKYKLSEFYTKIIGQEIEAL
jgi:hypothetical protein